LVGHDLEKHTNAESDSTVGRRGIRTEESRIAQECAGSHTAAAFSMAFENMFETWKHEHTPSTDSRNKLINCTCSRHDILCHGIGTPAQQNCRHRPLELKLAKVLEAVNKRSGNILSELLYCVATMLDAMYEDCCFDEDKKQGLHEMLHTQLDKIETDTLTEEEKPRTDKAFSLLDMYDEILVENEMTEQMNNETAQQIGENIGYRYRPKT
jgi:hypothetical protein